MLRKRALIGVAMLGLILAGAAFAENQGAEKIDLKGEGFGRVHFSHILHQIRLGDCQVCHNLYAKEPDAIDKGVRAGALKRMQVMDQCKNCHSETAMAGNKSGPTSCRGCHWE